MQLYMQVGIGKELKIYIRHIKLATDTWIHFTSRLVDFTACMRYTLVVRITAIGEKYPFIPVEQEGKALG